MGNEETKIRQKKNNRTGVGHRILSIIGILICVVMIPVLVINFTLIIKGFINPDEVPSFLGVKPFIVNSGSMTGEIYTGDLVIVVNTDVEALRVDDIIAYKEQDVVITHRIIGLTEKDGELAFITKGDANNSEDLNPVLASAVEGKYMYRIPKLGDLAMFLQKPLGLIIFVAIPLTLFIVYDIMRRKVSGRRENKKEKELQQETERLKAELERLKAGQATSSETETEEKEGAVVER